MRKATLATLVVTGVGGHLTLATTLVTLVVSGAGGHLTLVTLVTLVTFKALNLTFF